MHNDGDHRKELCNILLNLKTFNWSLVSSSSVKCTLNKQKDPLNQIEDG